MLKHILSKQNRALLSELVRTDFKLRYQGSILGYAWSLLRPLFLFVILYIVFAKVFPLGKGVPHYPVYLLLGIVLWNFFTEVTTRSLTAIVERGDLIRKIKIPRSMIILSSSISAVINLLLNLVIVAVFMVINQVNASIYMIWLPLILVEIYILALGLAAFLSAAYVKYRDVSYIWEVILQAAFYMTPILYALTKIESLQWRKLILLNPMAQAIQDARYSIISQHPNVITVSRAFEGGWYRLIPFAVVGIIFLGGVVYFRKESKYFAENI